MVAPAATAACAGVAALKQLLAELGGDESRVKTVVGAPDAPSRAVLTLSPDEASALLQRYAGRLVMERNADLFPSTNSR
jgi:hypothetical protein